MSKHTKSLVRQASAFLMPICFVLLVITMFDFGKGETFLKFLGSMTLITALVCGLDVVINRPVNNDGVPLDVSDFTPTGILFFLLFAVLIFADLAGFPLLRQFER